MLTQHRAALIDTLSKIYALSMLSHRRFHGIVPGRLPGYRRFLGREDWGGQIVEFFQAPLSEPEDAEVGFVGLDYLIHLFKPNPKYSPRIC